MKKIFAMIMIVVAAMVFITGCEKKETETAKPAADAKPAATHEGMAMADDTVEQTICPVMGGPVNKDLFVEYKGKKVYLCCEDCVKMFKETPEKYLAKLPQFKDVADKAQAAATDVMGDAKNTMADMMSKVGVQTKCPVMGGPIDKQYFVEYKGKKVYFCCAGCDKTFLAEPDKYVAKLPQFGGKEE